MLGCRDGMLCSPGTPKQPLTHFMAAKIDKQVFISQLIKAFENTGIKKRELRRHLAQFPRLPSVHG